MTTEENEPLYPPPPQTLEEAKRRLIEAMGTGDVPYWFDEALRRIWAHRGMVDKARIYDISTPAARIRTAREIAGWTQQQLSARVGLKSHTTVGRIERGEEDASSTVFDKLCRVLRVSHGWVLGDTEEGGPPCPESGVMRRQFYPDYRHWDARQRARLEANAELERLRGLRPPLNPEWEGAKRREPLGRWVARPKSDQGGG